MDHRIMHRHTSHLASQICWWQFEQHACPRAAGVPYLRSIDGHMLMYVNRSDISEDNVPSDFNSCTRFW